MIEEERMFEATTISAERVAAFRLARHHLAQRASAPKLAMVAADMGGAQAQILSAAQLSLRARTRGLHPEDVDNALWRARTLAKIWCMRGTVHLVPSDDLAVFARGSKGRVDRDTHWLETHGLPAKLIDRILDALTKALDRPRTRKELAEIVAKTLGASAHQRSGRGWGAPRTSPGISFEGKSLPLGYLVFLASYRGLACAAPPVNGNEATFVRPDAWLSRWRDLPMEEAETQLLRRYLRAFGPATLKDFVAWVGSTTTRARLIWARVEDDLAPVRVDEEVRWLLRKDLALLQRAKFDRPLVRLLPYFDSYLMGHASREHLVDRPHYKRVYRDAGWVSSVMLVDGRVAGIWTMERKGGRSVIRVNPFSPFSREVREGIEAEVVDLGQFHETEATWTSRPVKP